MELVIERRGDNWMEISEIGANDRSFDLRFWQAQSPEARFRAGWEMVALAHEMKGGSPDELRLQRSPVAVEPI